MPFASETNAREAVIAAASVITPPAEFTRILLAVPFASFDLSIAAAVLMSAFTIESSAIVAVAGSAAIVIVPLPFVIVTPAP
ncbi:hypothetical protein D3C87_1343460 [compost metagenome]